MTKLDVVGLLKSSRTSFTKSATEITPGILYQLSLILDADAEDDDESRGNKIALHETLSNGVAAFKSFEVSFDCTAAAADV